jgi:hypothetical protein
MSLNDNDFKSLLQELVDASMKADPDEFDKGDAPPLHPAWLLEELLDNSMQRGRFIFNVESLGTAGKGVNMDMTMHVHQVINGPDVRYTVTFSGSLEKYPKILETWKNIVARRGYAP